VLCNDSQQFDVKHLSIGWALGIFGVELKLLFFEHKEVSEEVKNRKDTWRWGQKEEMNVWKEQMEDRKVPHKRVQPKWAYPKWHLQISLDCWRSSQFDCQLVFPICDWQGSVEPSQFDCRLVLPLIIEEQTESQGMLMPCTHGQDSWSTKVVLY